MRKWDMIAPKHGMAKVAVRELQEAKERTAKVGRLAPATYANTCA